jgi:hypothetical protein
MRAIDVAWPKSSNSRSILLFNVMLSARRRCPAARIWNRWVLDVHVRRATFHYVVRPTKRGFYRQNGIYLRFAHQVPSGSRLWPLDSHVEVDIRHVRSRIGLHPVPLGPPAHKIWVV